MMRFFAVPILVLCLTATSLASETKIDQDAAASAVETIILDKRTTIRQTLELSANEEQRFWPIYDAFEAEARVLLQELVETSYRAAIDTKSLSTEQADEIIDEFISTQTRFFTLQLDFAKKFREVLPPEKMIIFIGVLFSR